MGSTHLVAKCDWRQGRLPKHATDTVDNYILNDSRDSALNVGCYDKKFRIQTRRLWFKQFLVSSLPQKA